VYNIKSLVHENVQKFLYKIAEDIKNSKISMAIWPHIARTIIN